MVLLYISIYCDMEFSNYDGMGGWMRVGYLNMSEPNALCPPGLYTNNFISTDRPLCDRFIYPNDDNFNNSIEGYFVDGVTITCPCI